MNIPMPTLNLPTTFLYKSPGANQFLVDYRLLATPNPPLPGEPTLGALPEHCMSLHYWGMVLVDHLTDLTAEVSSCPSAAGHRRRVGWQVPAWCSGTDNSSPRGNSPFDPERLFGHPGTSSWRSGAVWASPVKTQAHGPHHCGCLRHLQKCLGIIH